MLLGHIFLVYRLHLVICSVLVMKVIYSNVTMMSDLGSTVMFLLELSVKLAMNVSLLWYTELAMII